MNHYSTRTGCQAAALAAAVTLVAECIEAFRRRAWQAVIDARDEHARSSIELSCHIGLVLAERAQGDARQLAASVGDDRAPMSRVPLAELNRRHFDVIVVGAGANGCSAAQHLAARGFNVLVVDKGDFASGTSSRSSRLLHCGLQYLVQETPLAGATRWTSRLRRPLDVVAGLQAARRTMQCRSQLVTSSPHRVHPLTFLYPLFEDSRYAPWQLKLAFKMLEAFGSEEVPLGFKCVSGPEAGRLPFMPFFANQAKLRSVIVFREYQYDWPERICLDAILDAERMGACIRNYTPVEAIWRRSNVWEVRLGDVFDADEHATVSASALLNIAGPWIDRVNALTGKAVQRYVIGIKGINVLVKFPEQCAGHGIECLNSQGHAYYAMPWGAYHFVGPTATIYEGNPDDARPLPEEVDFLIAETNRLFPAFRLTRSDVVQAWAGVRVRTWVSGNDVRRRSSAIHNLEREGMPNAFALTETPIMLHRAAGARLAERVARSTKPSGTRKEPCFAGQELPKAPDAGSAALPQAVIARLRHAAANEHAVCLVDLLFRRVDIGWGPDLGRSAAPQAARAVSDTLGWDENRIRREIDEYEHYVTQSFFAREVDVVAE